MGSEKTHKEKTRKQTFHGIVLGFIGNFVYVFSPPIRNDPKTHTHTHTNKI